MNSQDILETKDKYNVALEEFAHLIEKDSNDDLTNGLTVLTTKVSITTLKKWNLLLTKKWVNGKSLKQKFPKQYTSKRIYPRDLKHLQTHLRTLHKSPNKCIIRGELNPAIPANAFVNRRKSDNTFKDVPSIFVMFDLDSVPVKADWRDKPGKAINQAVKACLPKYFHNVKMLAAWSASQGFREGLRVHLWMELDQPMTSLQWNEWFNCQDLGKTVDGSVFRVLSS